MIVFKQKSFAIPLAAVGTIANGALMGASLIQGSKAAKQGEEQMAEQRRLQNQQLKAQAKQNQQMMDALKQVAKTNPTVAGAAAGQMMQQQFAISAASLSNFVKNSKGVAKDLLTVGKKMGAHKHMANALAMGTTAAGASYLVDKGIQANAKRNGIDLGKSDDRKENGKKLGKAALAAGATALAVVGAKRGYLGNSLQGTTNKYINRTNLTKVGNTMGKAFKEQFYDPKSGIKKGSIAITAGFAALPAIGYMTNKSAMKEQAKQTEEQKSYATPAAIGQTIRLGFNNVKRGVSSWSNAPVRNTLSGISSIMGGGGKKGTNKFINALKQQAGKSGNEGTAKIANFLGNHKTLAVGGSVIAGGMMLKPFELGDKAVKAATGAVDKNSMRYEKSQNKTVE